MQRKSAEIKESSIERVSQLITEYFEGKQTKLSDAAGISTVQINRIVKGKAGLTEYVARQIAAAVPDESIRYQWLLGEDDYKTEAEEIIARIKKKVDTVRYAQSGFELLLAHIGYERIFDPKTEETTLVKNGTGTVIGPSAMKFLEEEVVDFLEYRVHKLTGI